jgi:hypothetical protein
MDRFWIKVQKTDDCWLWTASKLKGYGIFKYQGKPIGAHRFSWYLTYGEWPKDMALHKCLNKHCVNPNHLYNGTAADNLQDAIHRDKTLLPPRNTHKGSNQSNAKLDENNVKQIRHLYSLGHYTQSQLAEKFNVSRGNINAILNFKAWKHVS